MVLDDVTITFKDVVEYYRSKSHIANKLRINVMTLETICLQFIQILNVIKYAHSLQEDTDA